MVNPIDNGVIQSSLIALFSKSNITTIHTIMAAIVLTCKYFASFIG